MRNVFLHRSSYLIFHIYQFYLQQLTFTINQNHATSPTLYEFTLQLLCVTQCDIMCVYKFLCYVSIMHDILGIMVTYKTMRQMVICFWTMSTVWTIMKMSTTTIDRVSIITCGHLRTWSMHIITSLQTIIIKPIWTTLVTRWHDQCITSIKTGWDVD